MDEFYELLVHLHDKIADSLTKCPECGVPVEAIIEHNREHPASRDYASMEEINDAVSDAVRRMVAHYTVDHPDVVDEFTAQAKETLPWLTI